MQVTSIHRAPAVDAETVYAGRLPYSRCLFSTLTFALTCRSNSALIAQIHRSRSSYHTSALSKGSPLPSHPRLWDFLCQSA